MVNYRYLGRSGLKITELTLGNWITGGGQSSTDTAIATVRSAGCRHYSFDTADVYIERCR